MYKNLTIAFNLLNKDSYFYKSGFIVQILRQIRLNYFYNHNTLLPNSSEKYRKYEGDKAQSNYFCNKNELKYAKLAAALGLTLALCNSPDMTGNFEH